MFKTVCLSVAGLLALFIQSVNAQGIEEWSSGYPDHTHINHQNNVNTYFGAPDISEALFVGTSTNNNTPAGTLNDVFAVDLSNTAQSILSANGVWGATADPENERILFTQSSGSEPPVGTVGGGDNLLAQPYTGGSPSLLGRITLAGAGLRIDGLALRNGRLYGFNAGNAVDNGFYQIDLNTFEATLIAANADSISGLDADPKTCIIYGTNDTTGQVVRIAPNGSTFDLAAYPVGINDIDGIAVGNGYAYLVTDENQDIAVLNLSTLLYETPLSSPFTAADTFSAGALAVLPPSQAEILDRIFDNGFDFDYCADPA